MTHVIRFVADHFFRVEIWLILAAWGSALLGAAIHYVWQRKQTQKKSIAGFYRFVLPADLWRHPSCRRDYAYAILNGALERFAVGSMLVGTGVISVATCGALSRTFGPYVAGEFSIGLWLAMIAATLIVTDFFTFLTHFLEHQFPVLWEIHKVHHSAEFLNPLSNRRHHVLQLVWEGGAANVAAGSMLGVASYLFHVPLLDNAILGADAFFFGNVLSFYQLRHSHIPLHYGRLENWLLSPAQHQLHHSVEVQDWDRNFGLLTAVWDRLFGTLTRTKANYVYRLGLEPEYQRQYDTVWKLFSTPFVNIARMSLRRLRSSVSAINGGAVLAQRHRGNADRLLLRQPGGGNPAS